MKAPAAARRSPIACATASLIVGLVGALVGASPAAQAQDAAALPAVTVNPAASAPPAEVSGFGDVPLRELPLSATVIDGSQLRASGARRLSDLTQFDASVTDAYNSAGYWDYLTVRGFVLDNRFNYRREGLPISAETSIPLDNKERVEILRGTSGIQAGTSAPGGLVNYVVKRPTEHELRTVRIETTSRGSLLGAVDLGGRFGERREFGWRLNVAAENLKPLTHDLDGNRNLFALAGDWRITRDSVLELEVEKSRKTQPSQNGFSLLGGVLPAPVDPRINLNNQPWSQPSEFDALTGTLRFSQALGADWRWSAQIGRQRLRSDDRLAYAFGCGAEGNYDRYCSDGTFDVYDFRSENERRTQTAGSLSLKGNVATGSVRHELGVGLLQSRVRNRFQNQAYNYAGTGNVWATSFVPPAPDATTPQTDRDERSTELTLQDAIRWNDRFTTWIGVRHTRLDRASIGNDGSNPTGYRQNVTTPWVALSYMLRPGLLAYASWGKGVESQVVPNRPDLYANAGQALPALESRQWEIGLKGGADAFNWQLAWFDISRPLTNLDACAESCQVRNDGRAVHRGLEAGAQWNQGPWRLGASVSLIDAKRRGSTADPALNGQSPTNVPKHVLRAQAAYRIDAVPGLEIAGQLSHEGRRGVLPDGSITLPSWTRLDAVLRYDTRLRGVDTSWSLAIDNVFDRRYWKESPYQFGHVYLFPGAPRTLRLGVSVSL